MTLSRATAPSAACTLDAIDAASVEVSANAADLAMFAVPERPVDRFFVLGFNRRSAGEHFDHIKQAQVDSIGQRPAPDQIVARLRGVRHGVVLATCCRVELHGLLDVEAAPAAGGAAGEAIIEDFLALFGFTRAHHPMLDLRQGEAAAEHVLWTCLGGDSVIPGETEIVGQLKQAYRAAHEAGVLGGAATLHRIYQRVFFLCRKLRRVHLPGSSRSMSLPKLVLGEVAAGCGAEGGGATAWGELRVGIVGAGEMGQAFARHLGWRGIAASRLTFFVHDPVDARRRAGFPEGATAVGLGELAERLRGGTIDVLLGAAGAGNLLGGDAAGWVPPAGRRRLLIVDVSVPPLVAEADAARLPRDRVSYVGFSRLADRQHRSREVALAALAEMRALVRGHAARLAAECDRRATRADGGGEGGGEGGGR